jgi:molecular chaperone GrpE
MKTSKPERRQIPVTDEARPDDVTPDSPPNDSAQGFTSETNGEDPTSGLQADLDRFRDLALRSQADFDNFKKRAAREKDDAIKYANSSLLERLISIVDNFELGLTAAKSEGEQSPIYSGMSMVLKQLQDFLTENGLRPIDAEGQKFDPNLHEAIAHEPSEDVPEGSVVRQMRRGYKLKDRLLRPSTVVVSSGTVSSAA